MLAAMGMQPRYIVVEGIDGTGKSTLIAGVKAQLERSGISVVTAVEPTDGAHGKEIRRRLGDTSRAFTGEQWLALFEADRRDNIENCVNPALAKGSWVLQDRSFYSSAAYQGAQGLDMNEILARSRAFAPEPDLVLVLDIEPAAAIERIRSKRTMETDAFERVEYLTRVRENFRSFRGANVAHLDAAKPAATVLDAALTEIRRRFPQTR